jgi:large subunit ribosomal protein L4
METSLEKLSKKQAIGLIHRLYITQLKNSYVRNASTKTKSEVSGGGRKPRPQKGQGYARSGSIRSPLWVGGGVIFGPKPQIYKKKINKKEKNLALFSAFCLKKQQLILNNELDNLTVNKTKNVLDFFFKSGADINNEKILCIFSKSNKEFWLASRNLKNVKITTANFVNIKELLWSNRIMLSENSFQILSNNFNKKV